MTLTRHAAVMIALMPFTPTPPSFSQSVTPPDPEQRQTETDERAQRVVVVTGARFSYPLVEQWIDAYRKVNPQVQIIVEARGSADPLRYDILAEVYEHDDERRKDRENVYVGRCAVLPVANKASAFARKYAEKGLNTELIRQIFFHDIFTDPSEQKAIWEPYTVYTRLQKAGIPIIFSTTFGYEQKDLKGTSIAGADAHVLKAVLRDSTGVTYLPLPLIYDLQTRKVIDGITVLPVDLNDNRKVNDEEKFYAAADHLLNTLETMEPDKIRNIAIGHLHLSVDKRDVSADAMAFLEWVHAHGQDYLHQFGFLKADGKYSREGELTRFSPDRRK